MIGFAVSFVSNASARSNRYVATEYQKVTITYNDASIFVKYLPDASVFSAELLVPVHYSHVLSMNAAMYDGGGDDSTGNGDTTDHDGDHGGNDSTDYDGGHDSTGFGDHDSTDFGGHDSTGFGDHDSTDFGGLDSSGFGGRDSSDGDHSSNDTIDCGHHYGNDSTYHHGDDDSTGTNDTTTRTFFGSGSQSIVIKTGSKNAFVTFRFVNNSTNRITISKLMLLSGTSFSITSGAPVKPMTLTPGATLPLTVCYTPNGHSGQSDQLLIMSNSTVAQNTIIFHGVNAPTASVSAALPAGVSVSVAPNPMASQLTVAVGGSRSTNISIYDLSGKLIRAASVNSTSWTWDGTASDGTQMINGTYFVRISLVSEDGTPFIQTEKIILNK